MDNEPQAKATDGVGLLASLQAEIAQMRIEMQAQLASQQETIASLREENQLCFCYDAFTATAPNAA